LNTRRGESSVPPPRRILVVEDHEWNARLLTALLVAAGFETRVAASGVEAQVLAESFRPDLILMDLELPDTSGVELTRALKADARTRDSIVVALTAHSPEDVAAEVAAAGGAGVLTKPVDPHAFGETVRRYLTK
jgi:two-component system, cell cycle response regulator DivK